MKLSANTVGLVLMGLVGLATLVGAPLLLDLADLFNLTIYIIMSILALSLALIWGYGGILCFGQAAFFGLGGYSYALAAINMGESTVPVLLAIGLPAAFAAGLGYFLFYGRLSDVYLGVITLVVTLILFNLIGSTAGPEYKLGTAYLGGYNGIPAVPPINVPGDPSRFFDIFDLFYLSTTVLLLIYFALRALLHSHFGRVIVSIRENELRAELLGYDVRLYKLGLFTIGAAIAGLAGCLSAVWGAYVGPNVFSLATTAQIIMWVIVGGLGTLVGPIIGCFALQILTTEIGTQQTLNTYLVLGGILLVFVSLVPRGVVPMLGDLLRWALDRARLRPLPPLGREQLREKT